MLAPISEALVAARRHHALLRAADWTAALRHPDCAYIVQDEVARELGWFDGPPRHWKSGAPARSAALTHAPLPPHGVRAGEQPAFDDLRLHAPGIEAEVALRLAVDVDRERAAALREEDADTLLDAMMVAIEIVDSRWLEGAAAPAVLRLADLQSHGALALGAAVPYARRDWSRQRCVVTVGEAPAVEHTGTHALGDPAWLLPQWLRHATREGDVVPAGTIVTTGTWCGVLPARAGDAVTVSFDGLGQAALRL